MVAPPSDLPINLAEAKSHLRVETGDDDGYINDLIATATDYLQQTTNLKLITQTWRQYVDGLNQHGSVVLEARPPQSIAEVTVFDAEGNSSVVPIENYQFHQYGNPAELVIHLSNPCSVFEIDIIAGFGDTGADVPDVLKRAILVLIAHWYEFRGAVSAFEQPLSLPSGFDALIAPFREKHL